MYQFNESKSSAVTSNDENGEVVVLVSRVLPEPKGKDLAERFRSRLLRRRQHKSRWAPPADAKLILDMHWHTYGSIQRGLHYAEMSVEIPVEGGTDTFTVTRSAKTRDAALLEVIKVMETSTWFHVFKERGVYFKVTGALEYLYRGYL